MPSIRYGAKKELQRDGGAKWGAIGGRDASGRFSDAHTGEGRLTGTCSKEKFTEIGDLWESKGKEMLLGRRFQGGKNRGQV